MCDTFYIPKNLNLYHANILCKNSDREPNEAQSIIHIHHTQHTSDKVKLTYIEIPQVKNTYEVYLSKPFQMWGAEMGVNECGVAIGNEAVFTKFSFAKKNNGLTGMDMIRLALERKNSAKSALEYIIELIETYGQDACGGYENKNFFYHNSFLIVDKKEAYCLETADKFWAYKKLNHFYAISNGLTILDDYDEIHPQAIEYAKQKKWYNEEGPFNFRKAFSDKFYTYMGKCDVRRQISEKVAQKEKIHVRDCIQTLQSHGNNTKKLDSMESICLHSGGLQTPSETTGSMIAILRDSIMTVWLTGTSHPCLSLYKPFFFGTDSLKDFPEPTSTYDHSLWWQAEITHRNLLENNQDLLKDYQLEQKNLQEEFIELEQRLIPQKHPSKKELEEVSNLCLQKEKQFYQKWLKEITKNKKSSWIKKIERPLYHLYRYKLNKKAQLILS